MSPTGNPRNSCRREAFTLIELVLVMVLLTVVISISAPSLGRFFKGRTLDSEAHRMVSLTRYARSRAVSEGIPMVLWIDPRKSEYGLTEQSGYGDDDRKAVRYTLADDLKVEVTDLPSINRGNASKLDASFGRSVLTIRFQPDGFIAESSPRTIHLSETKGGAVWIEQSTNRVSYAIQNNN